MSDAVKRVSHWKLMMIGTFSVTFRHACVIGLTVLSLVVWAVTVVGMGVLRDQAGFDGSPKSAEGAIVAGGSREAVVGAAQLDEVLREAADRQNAEPEAPQAETTVTPAEAEAEAAIGVPARDPFMANVLYFPSLVVEVADDGAGLAVGQGTEKGQRLKAESVVPMALEGILMLGAQRVAIIRGNALTLDDGRIMLLSLKELKGAYRVGDENVVVSDVRNRFRIGDKVEVHPIVKDGGGYLVGADVETLTVESITRKKVVFGLGGKSHDLEMRK